MILLNNESVIAEEIKPKISVLKNEPLYTEENINMPLHKRLYENTNNFVINRFVCITYTLIRLQISKLIWPRLSFFFISVYMIVIIIQYK